MAIVVLEYSPQLDLEVVWLGVVVGVKIKVMVLLLLLFIVDGGGVVVMMISWSLWEGGISVGGAARYRKVV